MAEATFSYDELSDTLYISFGPPAKASGFELNDHMILRVNEPERKAVGITVLEYSLVAQQTEIGPRSFPLTGLERLSEAHRELVLEVLQHPPVSEILPLSAYTPSLLETVPITSLQRVDP